MQILCATDFSNNALKAADVAAAFAKRLGMPLRLLHCVPRWPLVMTPGLVEGLWKEWNLCLEAEADRLRASGVTVHPGLRRGNTATEILIASREHETRMIVTGATGADSSGHWLTGSVTRRVAEEAAVPTLIVRSAEPLLSWLRNETPLKIMCGVDFDRTNTAALAAVNELQLLGKLQTEVAHVRHIEAGNFVSYEPLDHEVRKKSEAAETAVGQDLWDRVRGILHEAPVKVHLPSTLQRADAGLVTLASEANAGLLIVGAHSQHGWSRWTTPSVSSGVVSHAETNVLCVPAGAIMPQAVIPQFRRILAATDLSSSSNDVWRCALGLAAPGSEVRFLHVIESAEPLLTGFVRAVTYLGSLMADDKAQTEAQASLEGIIAAVKRPIGVKIQPKVVIQESAATGICTEAEEFAADVICLGSRGPSRLGSALFGPVAQRVVSHAQRPVLIVPVAKS